MNVPKGDEMARQTEQAKLLREARDQLASRAAALAGAKDKRGLIAMGLSKERASALVAGAEFNSEDLAELLGVTLPALRNWLSPKTSRVHREMPRTAKLLLERILADR